MKIYDIKDLKDLEKIQLALLNSEDFSIGKIEPIPLILELDGGRYKDYDISYIDANIARIILSQQLNFDKLIKELENNFDIQFSKEAKLLKFKLEKGSALIEAFLEKIIEPIMTMDSKDKKFVITTLILAVFSTYGYTEYLSQTEAIAKKQIEQETKRLEIAGHDKDKQRYADFATKALESLSKSSHNKIMQMAVNTPKKEALSHLEKDETFSIKGSNKKLTKDALPAFEYKKPDLKDTEEILDFAFYTVVNYAFRDSNKPFKIEGFVPLANSLSITPKQRMKLIDKAENQETVNLKLKIIKDGLSKKPKEVIILDFKY